jgi:hypothetical protein
MNQVSQQLGTEVVRAGDGSLRFHASESSFGLERRSSSNISSLMPNELRQMLFGRKGEKS